MPVVSSRLFRRKREDTSREGGLVEQRFSKERVERDNVLLYIEGDLIDPDDEQTLREQGYLDSDKKPRKAPADKARKATKNK